MPSGVYVGNKGKKLSEETRKKMSEAKKGKIKKGNAHHLWKGNNVGYSGLHLWVQQELGKPTKCECCGKSGLTGRKIHWANKSGKYKRELNDWMRLCRSCHCEYDDIANKGWVTRRNET